MINLPLIDGAEGGYPDFLARPDCEPVSSHHLLHRELPLVAQFTPVLRATARCQGQLGHTFDGYIYEKDVVQDPFDIIWTSLA